MDTTVVVIGAGPAGLAMSWALTEAGIDHVVLERSVVAHSWRHERWDSLRTLTPNWKNRLPGLPYDGADPDGYMTAEEVAERLDLYCRRIGAPVATGTTVTSVHPTSGGWRVDTDHGPWSCRGVVVATGPAGAPRVPALAAELPARIHQIHPLGYRRPDDVGDGRVLVVGASASGVQIAHELTAAGRDVTLAVGGHVRLPRTYRGLDIHRWTEILGVDAERWDEVDDLVRARHLPSPQLAGSHDPVDLHALRARGVEVVGRAAGVASGRLQCSGSLANLVANADLKQDRLLDRVDALVARAGLDVGAPDRPGPTHMPAPRTDVPLDDVDTVVWATGYRPTYPWLTGPLRHHLLDRHGRLVHDGGVLPVPAAWVLGLPVLRRRSSTFLDGIGADALDVAEHVAAHLGASRAVERTAV